MKPVFQTKKHNPPESYGNCYAACYASLLELDIEDVPPFELLPGFSKDDDTSDVWQRVLFSWLKAKGLRISVHRHEDGLIPVGYAMMGGKSPRGDWGHMCVVLDGKIVHDPAGDVAPIVERWDYIKLIPWDCDQVEVIRCEDLVA